MADYSSDSDSSASYLSPVDDSDYDSGKETNSAGERGLFDSSDDDDNIVIGGDVEAEEEGDLVDVVDDEIELRNQALEKGFGLQDTDLSPASTQTEDPGMFTQPSTIKKPPPKKTNSMKKKQPPSTGKSTEKATTKKRKLTTEETDHTTKLQLYDDEDQQQQKKHVPTKKRKVSLSPTDSLARRGTKQQQQPPPKRRSPRRSLVVQDAEIVDLLDDDDDDVVRHAMIYRNKIDAAERQYNSSVNATAATATAKRQYNIPVPAASIVTTTNDTTAAAAAAVVTTAATSIDHVAIPPCSSLNQRLKQRLAAAALTADTDAVSKKATATATKKSTAKSKKADNFYETLKMKELKELCRAANLSPTGLKQVLIDRLLNEQTKQAKDTTATNDNDDCMTESNGNDTTAVAAAGDADGNKNNNTTTAKKNSPAATKKNQPPKQVLAATGVAKEDSIDSVNTVTTGNDTKATIAATSSTVKPTAASAKAQKKPAVTAVIAKKAKKKRMTFQDELIQKIFFSCRPHSMKELIALMGKKTSEASIHHCLLTLIDKKWIMKKEFESKSRSKELYWANQECTDAKLWDLDCMRLPSPDDIRRTRTELAALQQRTKSVRHEIDVIVKTPSNAQLAKLRVSAERDVQKLQQQLTTVQTRIAKAVASAAVPKTKSFGGNKTLTVKKKNQKRLTPLQLMKNINTLRDAWKTRKQKCMDFVGQLSDGMEKTVKDVVKKVLELETDELCNVQLPPKHIIA